MIKHVVMFNLKPELAAEKERLKLEIKTRLEELPAAIEEIKGFEVGLNVKESNRAMDVVLLSDFESLEGLSKYSVHPKHAEFTSYIRNICDKICANDYEY